MEPTAATKPADLLVGSKLDGRVAFVTGGTRGIGAATCRSLASQGATVAAGYSHNAEVAQRFRDELTQLGAQATIHQGNVGSAEDCRRTVAEVIEQHGRLDILVNNAGITADKTVISMSADEWDKVLSVNLRDRSSARRPRSHTCSNVGPAVS